MKEFGRKKTDECTWQEAKEFREKVRAFLQENNIPYKSLRKYTHFGGKVVVVTGEKEEVIPLRARHRIIETNKETEL